MPMVYKEAPKFSAVDVFNSSVSLDNFNDDYTLLVFLRYSGCPWCNLAIHRLALEYDRLKKEHCQVIAFIQSDKKNVIDNIFDRHEIKPQFPIIADDDMKYYKQYDVNLSALSTLSSLKKIPSWIDSVRKHGFSQKKIDGSFFLVPAWFLINQNTGKIVKSEKGVSFYSHETFVTIYDSLFFKD
jgi:peroxiredoxin Q/BCP